MGILQTAQGFRGIEAETLEALGRELRGRQEARAGANAMVAIMRCLALSGESGLPGALAIAVERGCIDPVRPVLRAAVDMGTMDNSAALVALKPASSGFLASIRSASAIDQIAAAGGFRTQGLLERIGRVAVGGVAYAVDEGMAKPATSMGFVDLDALAPRKVVVWVRVTSEVFRFGNPSAATVINDNLGPALAVALDKDAFEQLISTSTPTQVSSGDPMVDIKFLTGNVERGMGSRLFFIGSKDALESLALHEAEGGMLTFNTLGLTGGTLFGVPTLVSDALTNNELILMDGKQIAFADLGVVPDVSRHGTVSPSDTGSGEPPVSLWQQNQVAPRLERTYGIASLGENALAVVTGIGASL